jgi:hypothetical protein
MSDIPVRSLINAASLLGAFLLAMSGAAEAGFGIQGMELKAPVRFYLSIKGKTQAISVPEVAKLLQKTLRIKTYGALAKMSPRKLAKRLARLRVPKLSGEGTAYLRSVSKDAPLALAKQLVEGAAKQPADLCPCPPSLTNLAEGYRGSWVEKQAK